MVFLRACFDAFELCSGDAESEDEDDSDDQR
jgi:hypothetical protein